MIATALHAFQCGDGLRYGYSSGDGLILLTSALSDCTPEKYVHKRLVLPKISHAQLANSKDVMREILDFVSV